MFDCMLREASETLEGLGTMGTIHEFPHWRAQRSPQGQGAGEAAGDAQVVIFPGVRIEREESPGKPVAGTSSPVTSGGGRQAR